MSWFGTDAMALACIMGGAAVGGGATLALMDGGDRGRVPCAVEAMAHAPRAVVVARGGEARTIVVTPDVRIRTHGGCGVGVMEDVRAHLFGHHEHLKETEIHLKSLERQLEFQMEGLAKGLEGLQVDVGVELEEAVQARVEAEMRAVQKRLEKLGGAGIR